MLEDGQNGIRPTEVRFSRKLIASSEVNLALSLSDYYFLKQQHLDLCMKDEETKG